MPPPRLVRRLVLAPLVVVLAVALTILVPLIGLVTLAFGAVRRSRPGREARVAAAVLRAGLVHRGDGGVVHLPRPLGCQRIRRAAEHRAVPGPPLRGHEVVPRPAVPGGHPDLPGAGRCGRAGTYRGGT